MKLDRFFKKVMDMLPPDKIYHIFDDIDTITKRLKVKYGFLRGYIKYVDIKHELILPYVMSNPDKNWNWNTLQNIFYRIIYNTERSDYVEFLCKHHDKITIWNKLTKFVSADFIQKHPDKNWDWKSISVNEFDINFLIQNKQFSMLSEHNDLTLDIVEKNIEEEWNWVVLTRNTPFKLIEERLDGRKWKWDIGVILRSKPVTLEFIKNVFAEMPWAFSYIGLEINPHITIDIVEDLIDEKWNFDFAQLVENGIIGVNFFVKYPEKINGCVLQELSKYCPIESVIQHFPEVVDLYYFETDIAQNKHITMKDIKSNIDNINVFTMFHCNTFEYMEQRIKYRTQSLYVIQKSPLSSEIVRHICETYL